MKRLTPTDIEERIERIPFSGCWIWMGMLNQGGYGQYGLNRMAHRGAKRTRHTGPLDVGLAKNVGVDEPQNGRQGLRLTPRTAIVGGNIVNRERKKLTPKQKVLRKFPKAAALYVSGCTVAIFPNGKLACESGDEPLSIAHTARAAWADAARKLCR